MEGIVATKVFISYAWEEQKEDDDKIKLFTQWLAVYLKKWGFDVLLDLFENHPGSKLDKFMSEGINSSKFVICICTETYIQKMYNPKSGVYNEITLLKEMSDSPFIIPIIEKGCFSDLPEFFEGKFVSELLFDTPYSQKNKDNIFELISTLRDESLSIKEVSSETRIDDYYKNVENFKFQAKTANLMSFECQTEQTVSFQYLLNGGDFVIGIPPMNFTTHWSTAGASSIYSCNKVQEMFYIHNFEEFEDIDTPSDIRSDNLTSIKWSTKLKIGDGIMWVNSNNYAAVGKILAINLCSGNEYKSEVTLQYKILNPIEISDDFLQDAIITETD
nr:toll/interleukin-1 receptor domain-containing protein [Lactococcus sp. S64]